MLREEVLKHTLVSALASEEELLVGTANWVCWHAATNSPSNESLPVPDVKYGIIRWNKGSFKCAMR